MKKFMLIPLLVLFGIIFFLVFQNGVFGLIPQKGTLHVQSQPASDLFINGTENGKTPFKSSFVEGDYSIKLISSVTPESPSWESTVPVVKNTESLVRVFFGNNSSDTSSEILFFNPIEKKSTQLTVTTTPDFAQAFIDGSLAGTTPLSVNEISEGEHSLRLLLPDYAEKELKFETKKGYLLNIEVVLKKTGTSSESAQSTKPLSDKKSVQIVSPETGWLRVRSEPSRTSEEIGKVNDGTTQVVLETQNDWIKIELEDGKTGWISSEYTKEVE
jgi:hypothetical protein